MKTTAKALPFIGLLCIIALNLNNLQAQTPGFFLDDWQPLTATLPLSDVTDKTTSSPTVTVTIDGSGLLNKVPEFVYGNNAVSWDNGMPKNTTAMTDLKNLNPHVLRWPGGSLSDNYFWNVPYGQRPADIPSTISPWYGTDTQDWQMSTDEYYAVLNATNSVGMITVNYGYARYGTSADPVAMAAHMAADWVRYDNGRSKFWEIGNEDFGSWESGYKIDPALNQDGQPEYISGQLYGQHCKVFMDSMRVAAAEIGVDIKIGVVAFDAESSYDAIQTNWNEQMMAEVGGLADFISVHSYYTPYDQNSSASVVLNSHTVAEDIMNQIKADMAETGNTMLPLAMTEWNIFAVGSMQAVSFINGMHAALVLGEYIKNGYGFSSRWDLVNGWDNGNDHAIFSTGGEPGVDAYNPRPAFFYMYYFQKYFGDQMISSQVNGNSDVIAYASTFSSGQTGVVLINKSENNETVQLDAQNIDKGVWYYYHVLTGGNDNGDFSRKVLINGIETDEQGGGPDEYASIKAYATETDGGILVDLPARGVVYLMIDIQPPVSYVSSLIESDPQMLSVKISEEVKFSSAPSGFTVMANGVTELTISNIEIDPLDARFINIYFDAPVSAGDELSVSYSGTEVLSLDDVLLPTFTDEPVKNLLPGEPASIKVIVKNRETAEAMAGCTVVLNEETLTSDVNGEALFTVPEGETHLKVSKKLFVDVEEDLLIRGDSTITVLLDSTLFQVKVLTLDADRGTAIAGVSVNQAGEVLNTDASGIAVYTRYGGSLQMEFSRLNYEDLTDIFDIESDTTLEVELTRNAAAVKFRTKNEGSLLYDVSITIGEETLVTNTVGICTFASVPVKENVDYTAEKKNFATINGTLFLTADSTVNLDLKRIAADITFIVSAGQGEIDNGGIVVSEDTTWLNENHVAVLESVPVGQQYQYTAFAAGFADYSSDFYAGKDSTIYISLLPDAVSYSEKDTDISIYPNPSDGSFRIVSGKLIKSAKICDLSGKTLVAVTPESTVLNIEMKNQLQAGIYILLLEFPGGYSQHKLVIR